MILAPDLLQTSNGGTRQPGRLLANQSRERFGKVAGGDAFEVQDRDEHLQALRAPGVGRQDRGPEPNPVGRGRGLEERAAGGETPRRRLVLIDCGEMPRAYELAGSVGRGPVESLLKEVETLLELSLRTAPGEML